MNRRFEFLSAKYRCIYLLVCLVGSAIWTTPLVYQQDRSQKDDVAWSNDFFAAIVGKWNGSGTYDGNQMKLQRSWTLELNDCFLRGDMKVLMSNGASFRSLTYWRKVAPNQYECTWMDESGQNLNLQGLGDNKEKTIDVQHLSTGPGGPPTWQRTIYRINDKDSYQETIYRSTADGWKLVAEFKFTREQ